MTDAEILRAAILRSGLSNRQFARNVLHRNERLVRRWVSGQRPIPPEVTHKLRNQLGSPTRGLPNSSRG